jgi:hypothetical protein
MHKETMVRVLGWRRFGHPVTMEVRRERGLNQADEGLTADERRLTLWLGFLSQAVVWQLAREQFSGVVVALDVEPELLGYASGGGIVVPTLEPASNLSHVS